MPSSGSDSDASVLSQDGRLEANPEGVTTEMSDSDSEMSDDEDAAQQLQQLMLQMQQAQEKKRRESGKRKAAALSAKITTRFKAFSNKRTASHEHLKKTMQGRLTKVRSKADQVCVQLKASNQEIKRVEASHAATLEKVTKNINEKVAQVEASALALQREENQEDQDVVTAFENIEKEYSKCKKQEKEFVQLAWQIQQYFATFLPTSDQDLFR